MKQLLRTPATDLIDKLTKSPVKIEVPSSKNVPTVPRYTLRLEDGIIQLNNISATPERVTYTLMAQKPDGSTELITRDVSLAPFQVIEDQAEGMKVVAAWSKN